MSQVQSQDFSAYNQPQNQEQQGVGEDNVIDYQQIIEDYRGKLGEQGKQLGSLKSELEETKKKFANTEGIFSKMKNIFTGKEEQKPDPVKAKKSQHEQSMDYVLSQVLAAQKQGREMPVTAKIGTDLYALASDYEERFAKQQEVIDKLNQKIEMLSSPDTSLDVNAGHRLETMLMGALDTVYGDTDDSTRIKAAQFDSAARLIGEEIKDLKENDPQKWNRIRRDQSAMQKMVNHFVKMTIPPKAREIMEKEHIENEPTSIQDLWAAFKEAKEASVKDPRFKEIAEKIRHEILEHEFAGKRGGKGIINQLING